MSSYQEVLKDMFRKHKGSKQSKDIMRLASLEWNKLKNKSGRGLPDDPALLNAVGGALKKSRKKKVEPSVISLPPATQIPSYDSTGVSPYGEYVMNKQLRSLPASQIQVAKQLNFNAPRLKTSGRGYGVSAGGMGVSAGGMGVSAGAMGGSFWDDFSSGFSSVFQTVAPFLGALL